MSFLVDLSLDLCYLGPCLCGEYVLRVFGLSQLNANSYYVEWVGKLDLKTFNYWGKFLTQK